GPAPGPGHPPRRARSSSPDGDAGVLLANLLAALLENAALTAAQRPDAFAGNLVQGRVDLLDHVLVGGHPDQAFRALPAVGQFTLDPPRTAKAKLPGINPAHHAAAQVRRMGSVWHQAEDRHDRRASGDDPTHVLRTKPDGDDEKQEAGKL